MLLADERARERLARLAVAEANLDKIAAATKRARKPLRVELAIALHVGRFVMRLHMARYLALTIADTAPTWVRKGEADAAAAALEGRPVRDPHQSVHGQARCVGCRGRLQEPADPLEAGRAFDKDGGTEPAPGLPLQRAACTHLFLRMLA